MLYDSQRDRIVVFGGQTTPAPKAYKDLWAWTFGGGWECLSPLVCNIETP